uniref:Uncharacterized protein n=1 Tax=Anguilla anguilla TaxID=7936 RepID=A0A0E9X306_ANGAN
MMCFGVFHTAMSYGRLPHQSFVMCGHVAKSCHANDHSHSRPSRAYNGFQLLCSSLLTYLTNSRPWPLCSSASITFHRRSLLFISFYFLQPY